MSSTDGVVTYGILSVTSGRMLTETQVAAATYAGDGTNWDVRWDGPDGVPGFGCRVYPSGRKSYIVIYRVGGRRRTLAIGSTARLSVVEARGRARRVRIDAADGIDPLAERRRRRGMTCAELFVRYLTDHARPRKARRTCQDDARRLGYRWDPASGRFREIDYERRSQLKRSLIRDRFGPTTIGEVRTQDIEDLHRLVGEQRGPYEANRQQELLRSIFYWARERGFLPADAGNPARAASRSDPAGVVRFREGADTTSTAAERRPSVDPQATGEGEAPDPERLRAEAEALLEEADRTHEAMRQRAIDLLKRAEQLREQNLPPADA